MKIKMILFSLLFFCMQSYGQQNKAKFDIANCKMKLTEYLLSCHAVIMSALEENDATQKYYLGDMALEYYNKASEQFSLLKRNTKLDGILKNDIEKMLQAYSEVVSDKSKLFKPEISFALYLMDKQYEHTILPKLWGSK